VKLSGYVFLVATAFLSACGGSRHITDEVVQSPYVKRAKILADVGISAMQNERWDYARSVFVRALKAAQLTDDPLLMAKQWYNLGTVQGATKNNQEALRDFHEAQALAERAGDLVMIIRAQLARALLSRHADDWQLDVLPVEYPIDVHLALARLAQKQKRYDVAKQEYHFVLKKNGKSRLHLLYQAQAHLGLAMLARERWNIASAQQEVEESLDLFRQVGSPRLVAYALLFYGKLEIPSRDRKRLLQRALVIYQALGDVRGQRTCRLALTKIENPVGNAKSVTRLESLQERKN